MNSRVPPSWRVVFNVPHDPSFKEIEAKVTGSDWMPHVGMSLQVINELTGAGVKYAVDSCEVRSQDMTVRVNLLPFSSNAPRPPVADQWGNILAKPDQKFFSDESDDPLRHESSSVFDLENIRPFLERVSRLMESGFGTPEIDRTCKVIDAMEHGTDEELHFTIRHAGIDCHLRLGIFMDEIDAPDLRFFCPPALAAQIDEAMDGYFEELGI